jgi:hypothetical protein
MCRGERRVAVCALRSDAGGKRRWRRHREPWRSDPVPPQQHQIRQRTVWKTSLASPRMRGDTQAHPMAELMSRFVRDGKIDDIKLVLGIGGCDRGDRQLPGHFALRSFADAGLKFYVAIETSKNCVGQDCGMVFTAGAFGAGKGVGDCAGEESNAEREDDQGDQDFKQREAGGCLFAAARPTYPGKAAHPNLFILPLQNPSIHTACYKHRSIIHYWQVLRQSRSHACRFDGSGEGSENAACGRKGDAGERG